MKYKVKMYAEGLVNALLDKKNQLEDKKIINNFLKLLEVNGDIKKADQIIELAENIYLKKTGKKKIVLEKARKADAEKFIGSFAKKGDQVQEKINPSLVAGIKVTVNGDKQIDFSLLGKLENIFKS